MSELTPRQARFVEEYMIDLNATQAATRAGYSKKTANEQGARLLAKASVREEIENRKKIRSETAWLTREKVLRDLESVKENSMSVIHDQFGNPVLTDSKAALRALELQGRHLGMFTDRVEHSGSIGLEGLVSGE